MDIRDAEGQTIHGLTAADISIRPGELVTAALTMEMHGPCNLEGRAKFYLHHPSSGHRVPIRSVTLEDGSVWEAPSAVTVIIE